MKLGTKIASAIAGVGVAALVSIGLLGGGVATAAPGPGAVHLDLDRTVGTSLNVGAGAYWNMTEASAKWHALNNVGGFVIDNSGITVPQTGVYTLNWQVITNSGGTGICGFALNDAIPNGGILYGIGPVMNFGAGVGNGTFTGVLGAGTKVDFWCYGNGGTFSLQDTKATSIEITLIDNV